MSLTGALTAEVSFDGSRHHQANLNGNYERKVPAACACCHDHPRVSLDASIGMKY